MLYITPTIQIPRAEFRFSFARSSGPGGQNVNKVNSKVTLLWPIMTSPSLPSDVRNRFCARYRLRINKQGELVLQSQRHREQARNVEDCLDRVRVMVAAVAAPPKQRRATRPTRGSQERRLRAKRSSAQKKQSRGGRHGAD